MNKKLTASALLLLAFGSLIAVGSQKPIKYYERGGKLGKSNEIRRVIDCTGKPVNINYKGAYYCASVNDYASDKSKLSDRIKQNKLNEESDKDFIFARMLIKNDATFRNEIKDFVKTKYDLNKKEFNMDAFRSSPAGYASLISELASKECDKFCKVDFENLTEDIYKLMSK